MAKSLRSKWKRKMKAIKRVRYGEKETAKLVKMVEQTKKDKEDREREEEKERMEHDPQVLGGGAGGEAGDEVTPMDEEARKKLSLKNEHGTYPVWVSNI